MEMTLEWQWGAASQGAAVSKKERRFPNRRERAVAPPCGGDGFGFGASGARVGRRSGDRRSLGAPAANRAANKG